MNKDIVISMVVPCYNCESTLERTLVSVINQIDVEGKIIDSIYQVVLVDDGSSDSTSNICDTYAERFANVTVIHQPNGGLMNAWKRGVTEADGEYIVFADADDYVDNNLIATIINVILENNPDIITYGLKTHYDNGEIVESKDTLKTGMYDRVQLDDLILPNLYSNGRMQSEILYKSRWIKAFRKIILTKVMDNLPDEVSFGEDDLTHFAAINNCDSLYYIANFRPYHYVRNAMSMIGKYDRDTFDKIRLMYKYLYSMARMYEYEYINQIKQDELDTTMLYLKKEICRNPARYTVIANKIREIVEADYFVELCKDTTIDRYGIVSKSFAWIVINHYYIAAIVIVRIIEKIRKRKV